jgi:GNAT superfamily N-acetyltransferase
VAADLRELRADDLPFLEEVVLLAVNWDRSRPPMTLDEVRIRPDLAHYLVSSIGERDGGVVAVVDGRRVGAAWWTWFSADDPGYGFVADDVPEITIGVIAEMRGKGLGRRLLTSMHQEARARGIARLSLSVEKQNPAVELYRRAGYEIARDDETAWTMVVTLRSAPDDEPG